MELGGIVGMAFSSLCQLPCPLPHFSSANLSQNSTRENCGVDTLQIIIIIIIIIMWVPQFSSILFSIFPTSFL
jgi:hypothetical protein